MLLRLRTLLEIILIPYDLLITSFVDFRFGFGILPKHRTFNLNWMNERYANRMFDPLGPTIGRWAKSLPLNCLGLKTCFCSSLRLMIGFSHISRLWGLNKTFWRSCVIQVSKNHMDTCYYQFSHSIIILCIKTFVFITHMKDPFNCCELYFVKMCD
jgi:hypothetical protein